jgi:alkylation response protein AidB-like acyl-CoA dehydrogenase
MFRMGMMPLTGAGHAAFALGIGRRALDEVRALSGSIQRMGDPVPLAGLPTFQKEWVRADARLRAARLLVMDTFGDALETSRRGDPVAPGQRARLRAAANLATEAAREAADLAHERAGTAAIRDGRVLERLFRDVHTGTQHAFIGEKVWLDAAGVLLGRLDDVFSL